MINKNSKSKKINYKSNTARANLNINKNEIMYNRTKSINQTKILCNLNSYNNTVNEKEIYHTAFNFNV